MGAVASFFLSVLAGVVSYYICKWLDNRKNRKTDYIIVYSRFDVKYTVCVASSVPQMPPPNWEETRMQ